MKWMCMSTASTAMCHSPKSEFEFLGFYTVIVTQNLYWNWCFATSANIFLFVCPISVLCYVQDSATILRSCLIVLSVVSALTFHTQSELDRLPNIYYLFFFSYYQFVCYIQLYFYRKFFLFQPKKIMLMYIYIK